MNRALIVGGWGSKCTSRVVAAGLVMSIAVAACGGSTDRSDEHAPGTSGSATGGTAVGGGASQPAGSASGGRSGGAGEGGEVPSACVVRRDEAPGQPLYDGSAVGSGDCADVTLAQVLGDIEVLRPDLSDVSQLYAPDPSSGGYGSMRFAFRRPDGGFAVVFYRGAGDCPSGCTIHDYWYFETGADCEVTEVGEAHRDFQHCMQPDQLPRWGIPRAAMPSEICDADLSPQDVSGRYSLVTCGRAVASCAGSKAPSQEQPLPASTTFTVQQYPDEPSRGIVIFSGTQQGGLDDTPFEATIERQKITAQVEASNLPSKCPESWSLAFEYDFEGLGERRLTFNRSISPDCANNPDHYCKDSVAATFGEATREADACIPVECAGLDEEACQALPATDTSSGCVARYGAAWPDAGDEERLYVGCASGCCGNGDCVGYPDAEACVMSPERECWTVSSPPAPDGWQLLAVGSCADVPDCRL